MRISKLLILAYMWAGAGLAPPAWALETSETQHDLRARSGRATIFGGVYSSVQECSPIENLRVRLESAPRLGRFEARPSTHAPRGVKVEPVENCPIAGLRGYDFVYRAAPDAHGEDVFSFLVEGPGGAMRRHVVQVNVE